MEANDALSNGKLGKTRAYTLPIGDLSPDSPPEERDQVINALLHRARAWDKATGAGGVGVIVAEGNVVISGGAADAAGGGAGAGQGGNGGAPGSPIDTGDPVNDGTDQSPDTGPVEYDDLADPYTPPPGSTVLYRLRQRPVSLTWEGGSSSFRLMPIADVGPYQSLRWNTTGAVNGDGDLTGFSIRNFSDPLAVTFGDTIYFQATASYASIFYMSGVASFVAASAGSQTLNPPDNYIGSNGAIESEVEIVVVNSGTWGSWSSVTLPIDASVYDPDDLPAIEGEIEVSVTGFEPDTQYTALIYVTRRDLLGGADVALDPIEVALSVGSGGAGTATAILNAAEGFVLSVFAVGFSN